jgi:peptidoglycan/xylan/chitin deacetylase (PgdA/CDA1 family)
MNIKILTLMISVVMIQSIYAQDEHPQTKPYVPADENQLMTLGASPKGGRFELKDITWPENPGDAEVCLWKDDKYAAASITIDDNCKPDHDWWLEQCKKNDIKVTWFVITGGVGGSNAGFSGEWEDFQKLIDAGCAVESHSSNHKRSSKESDEFARKIFAESQYDLNTKLKGNKCFTIAYPYGDGNAKIAGEYFIAARGTSGQISNANSINYLNTSKGAISQGFINVLLTGNTGEEYGPKWLNKLDQSNKRGWITPLYHYVPNGNTPEEKKANKERAEKEVANLASYKDQIWIDTFPAVALYGQERDSSILTSKLDENKITMNLTDRMRDDIFDVPLTIKVRLPDSWKGVKAIQNGKDIQATFVSHENQPYALVYGVPDKGEIEIVNGKL